MSISLDGLLYSSTAILEGKDFTWDFTLSVLIAQVRIYQLQKENRKTNSMTKLELEE